MSSTSHQRLVQLEDDEEEKIDGVKMEEIKGGKVVSVRRVGETTFTVRRYYASIFSLYIFSSRHIFSSGDTTRSVFHNSWSSRVEIST